MNLTVLGNNGPFPATGGACSGYLLTDDNIKILIDCGSGVVANLQRYISFEELDAIILTHLHSDHISDMFVLRYGVQTKRSHGLIDKGLDVYLPGEPSNEYNLLNLKGVFNLKTITSAMTLKFGNITVSFEEMTHPVKCFAVCFEDGKKKFVFSGDTSWNEKIIAFGKNADLLMLDAGLRASDKTYENVPHLTAGECGRVASLAHAKRLLLTHFRPDYKVEDLKIEAMEYFDGVEVSEILKTYSI